MSGEPSPARDLLGFDPAAIRAVELAEREARELGHDRVGTEHLLLGLLTNDSDASQLLATTGVKPTAARGKVDEAVGASIAAAPWRTSRAMPRTPRATRALGRAPRFARAAGSDPVTSEHLLLAVLDVEGTAGQVLRGLGVDVDALRHALDGTQLPVTTVADDVGTARGSRCASCGASLDELVSRVVTARDADGRARDAVVFSCPTCAHAIGASWHRAR